MYVWFIWLANSRERYLLQTEIMTFVKAKSSGEIGIFHLYFRDKLKNTMLDYLELLMLTTSGYLWPSVRIFHSHMDKQIELCCLGWMSSNEIRDKAVTFFKHSHLHSNQTRTSSAPLLSASQATPPILVHLPSRKPTKLVNSGTTMTRVNAINRIQNLTKHITNVTFFYKRASHDALPKEEKSYTGCKFCMTTTPGQKFTRAAKPYNLWPFHDLLLLTFVFGLPGKCVTVVDFLHYRWQINYTADT